MREEIIVAGFGGQGVLAAGRLLCIAAIRNGLHATHIPSYGAEMRGGTANCSVIISDDEIASPVVEHMTMLLVLNGPSMAKFEPQLAEGGVLIYNSSLIRARFSANSGDRPGRSGISYHACDANAIAEAEGNPKAANMALIGTLFALRERLGCLSSLDAVLNETITGSGRSLNGANARVVFRAYEEAKAAQ